MADPVITNVDNSNLVLVYGQYEDDTLTAAGAGTIARGTILARDSSTLKLVVFVKGGTTNENGIPKRILTEDVVFTGAGDKAVRVPAGGTYRKDKLIIAADGDATNVDAAVIDQMLDYTIVTRTVTEQNILDNQ
jgi:hypothetical protein